MRAIVAVVFLTVMGVPAQGPSPQAREVMRTMGHGEGTLKPGEMAPDFDLRLVQSTKQVRLSSFRGKRPVALVFGSYS